MKKYVILGYVYGVGGWQTYIANKLSIMEKEGYKIYAVSNSNRKMSGKGLPILKQFYDNKIDEFFFPFPSELNTRVIVGVVDRFKTIIDYHEDDEIIIEATLLDLFLWAEYLAQQLNGRSICVEVSNRFKKYPHSTLDFFDFKAKRGELIMMSKTGLHELFSGYIDYPEIDTNTVGALTQNEFQDDGKDYKSILDISSYDYIIGTVGWLNKGYYKVLIDEVIKFCGQNPDKKVQFIVVGKSTRGDVEKIYKQKADGVANLKLSLMGSIAPVPSNLVKLFDVSVSSYGCAMITDKLGVTTISMHDPENIPLGIVSYTITDSPFNQRVNYDKTICDLLTDILVNKVCENMERKDYPYVTVDEQKEKHLKRIREFPPKIEYYDVLSLKKDNASVKHKAMVIIQKTFGIRAVKQIIRLLGK